MTRIKVSELSGVALDWAVAKCEGYLTRYDYLGPARVVYKGKRLQDTHDLIDEGASFATWEPSTDWSQGGPIMDRENIDTHAPRPVWPHWKAYKPEWNGGSGLIEDNVQYGPTRLIAAMRCYVASKLGDEIDIPEELL